MPLACGRISPIAVSTISLMGWMGWSMGQGIAIEHGGRAVALKWHRLRRRMADPLFSAENLREGMRVGASMEIDLRVTRDGDFAVLHDETLDRETDGKGSVRQAASAELVELFYDDRDVPDAPRFARPLMLLDELEACLEDGHPQALLQFDMKDDLAAVGHRGVEKLARLFARHEEKLIVSGDSTELTLAILEKLPGMKWGLEPSFRLLDLYRAGRKDALVGQLVAELTGPHRPHMVYLWWDRLVLPAAAEGIDLIRICHHHGALVDAWTFNLADPEDGFSDEEWEKFSTLLELGADQISTDDAIATELAYRKRMGNG
jgi:glycerophosphoryl diester phosphodiesterase